MIYVLKSLLGTLKINQYQPRAKLENLISKIESRDGKLYSSTKDDCTTEKFRLKSTRVPPQNQSLNGLQEDIHKLAKVIKVKIFSNPFQIKLAANKIHKKLQIKFQ